VLRIGNHQPLVGRVTPRARVVPVPVVVRVSVLVPELKPRVLVSVLRLDSVQPGSRCHTCWKAAPPLKVSVTMSWWAFRPIDICRTWLTPKERRWSPTGATGRGCWRPELTEHGRPTVAL
jgi:hypothetical protein